jgi:hypothetical protein
MTDSINLQKTQLNVLSLAEQFQAMVNGKPFVAASVTAWSCWRAELRHKPNRRIWKVLATGHVTRHSTSIGLFIDQTLGPGTYDLVNNPCISVVYHRTPRQMARVYHSRYFQTGELILLECNPDTRRLRGTLEFGMSSINFKLAQGAFNLQWINEAQDASAQ